MIDEMSEANSVAGHWKMKLHCNQGFPQSENTSKVGRAILLMFTRAASAEPRHCAPLRQ
jgi:hypothetical protein